jgi:hypothetical protein
MLKIYFNQFSIFLTLWLLKQFKGLKVGLKTSKQPFVQPFWPNFYFQMLVNLKNQIYFNYFLLLFYLIYQLIYFRFPNKEDLLFFSILSIFRPITFLGAYIFSKLAYWIFGNILKRITAKTKTRIDDILVELLEKPIWKFWI